MFGSVSSVSLEAARPIGCPSSLPSLAVFSSFSFRNIPRQAIPLHCLLPLCLDQYLQEYLPERILRTLSSRSGPPVFQKRSDLKKRSIEIFIAESLLLMSEDTQFLGLIVLYKVRGR